MKTPNVQTIQDDVLARFPGSRAGQWACRRIAGLTTWSQHAYTEERHGYFGNASDIFPKNMSQGDAIAAYIRGQLHVKAVLWRVKNHFDHVHYDTWPTGIGLPPCKGGALRVEFENGKIGRTFQEEDLPLTDEDLAKIAAIVDDRLNAKLGATIAIPGEPSRLTTQGIVNGFHAKTRPAEPNSKIFERIEATYQATKG